MTHHLRAALLAIGLTVSLLLLSLPAPGPLSIPPARASQGEGEAAPGSWLDISRVVPYPADFSDAIADLGFLDGRFYAIEEEAARTASRNGGGPAETAGVMLQLVQSGWLQRYENRLAAPLAEDSEQFRIQVSSFAVEYATSNDATVAFDALTAGSPIVDSPAIGDESALTLLSGVTGDTDTEYRAAKIVYRVGPVVGSIIYADLLNQQPDLDLLTRVARAVVERGTVVVNRETVPLGSMVVRLDRTRVSSGARREDRYDTRAGTLTLYFAEDPANLTAREADFTPAIDVFASRATASILPPEPDEIATPEHAHVAASPVTASLSPDVDLQATLLVFPSQDDAEAWIAKQQAQTAAQGDRFRHRPEAVVLGDATLAYEQIAEGAESDTTAPGYLMFARAGAIVAVLDITSTSGISLNGALGLLDVQVDCMIQNGCLQLAPIPQSLFGGVDPAVEPRPIPTAVPEPVLPVVEIPDVVPTEAAPPPVAEVPIPTPDEAPPPVTEEPTPPVEEPPAPPATEPPSSPVATEIPEPEPPPTEAPPTEPSTPAPGETETPVESPTPTETPAEPTPAPPTPVPTQEGQEPAPPPTPAPEPPLVQDPTPFPEPAPVVEPTPPPTVAPTPDGFVEPVPVITPEPDDEDDDRRSRRDRERRKDRDDG